MPVVDVDPELWQPPPDDARLWRYIDFPKYVSMLTCRGLWFSRSGLLGDPYEGAMSLPTVVKRREMFTELGADSPMAIGIYESLRAATVKWVYVNCWHLSPHESAAMWRLYVADHGIAIVSSLGRIRSAMRVMPAPINVGTVQYVDYATTVIKDFDLYSPYLHKRQSFEHEREVRAILVVRPDKPPAGQVVEVYIDELIESVRVNPAAPQWFFDAVEAVTRVFGHSYDVVRSDLERSPIY